MALLLRTVRRGRWVGALGHDWLEEGDVAADPLADLRTSENTLSVWQVDDDKSNLLRIVAAFASTRDTFANFDFALVQEEVVADLGIEIRHTNGLARLAKQMVAKSETRRIPLKQVKQLIEDAVNSNQIDVQGLNNTLKQRLG